MKFRNMKRKLFIEFKRADKRLRSLARLLCLAAAVPSFRDTSSRTIEAQVGDVSLLHLSDKRTPRNPLDPFHRITSS
ncbi:hypothetical protein FRC03_000271 [Tulasnella sp. 419]|nr:hypothetical protein FRC03_000271 [Tulasnella sp. 419]